MESTLGRPGLARARRRHRGRGRIVAAVVVLALVAGGIAFLLLVLPRLLATAVERLGTDVTDTPVEVGGAGVDLSDAGATLRGLQVANPPGFASRPAMEVGALAFEPALGAIVRGDLVLERLVVRAPVVHVEVRSDEGVNVLVLRDRIRASARAGRAGLDDAEPGDVAAAELAETRIHVDTLSIEPVRVRVDASALGRDEPIELTLPDATLRDVEGTPADLVRTVTLSMLDRTLTAVGEEVGLEREDGLGGALRRGARALRDAIPDL